jgi:glycine cleavage system pyridoxal-binding protein P
MIGEVMQHRSEFVDRHIGPNQYQIQTMLLELGYKDLDSFISFVKQFFSKSAARRRRWINHLKSQNVENPV